MNHNDRGGARASDKARSPRRDDLLGSTIGAELTPTTEPSSIDPTTMITVAVGTTTLGFMLKRGRQGLEAFEAEYCSLGFYSDLKSRADAHAPPV
jgi:hypothetical protein